MYENRKFVLLTLFWRQENFLTSIQKVNSYFNKKNHLIELKYAFKYKFDVKTSKLFYFLKNLWSQVISYQTKHILWIYQF